uniref:Uncharacterized protein n=1 Tax=Opuntia streptacantha TaxID=393608 RepID=A0A7C9AUJ4_OPUST
MSELSTVTEFSLRSRGPSPTSVSFPFLLLDGSAATPYDEVDTSSLPKRTSLTAPESMSFCDSNLFVGMKFSPSSSLTTTGLGFARLGFFVTVRDCSVNFTRSLVSS